MRDKNMEFSGLPCSWFHNKKLADSSKSKHLEFLGLPRLQDL